MGFFFFFFFSFFLISLHQSLVYLMTSKGEGGMPSPTTGKVDARDGWARGRIWRRAPVPPLPKARHEGEDMKKMNMRDVLEVESPRGPPLLGITEGETMPACELR